MIFLMVLVLTALLCSCNMGMGLGSYEFKKIHIDSHNGSRCLSVEKWYDNETGIEVKTSEVGNVFISEGTSYFLITDTCPFCTQSTEKGGAE